MCPHPTFEWTRARFWAGIGWGVPDVSALFYSYSPASASPFGAVPPALSALFASTN